MSKITLKEGAQMLTASLVFGGPKTFDQIKDLEWLKMTSQYGISLYLKEAEYNGWIITKCHADNTKSNIYSATAKGKKMANERD